jgi:hypothetical protein
VTSKPLVVTHGSGRESDIQACGCMHHALQSTAIVGSPSRHRLRLDDVCEGRNCKPACLTASLYLHKANSCVYSAHLTLHLLTLACSSHANIACDIEKFKTLYHHSQPYRVGSCLRVCSPRKKRCSSRRRSIARPCGPTLISVLEPYQIYLCQRQRYAHDTKGSSGDWAPSSGGRTARRPFPPSV